MNVTEYALAPLFVLLALAALPRAQPRCLALAALAAGGHLAVFAGVLACGLFAALPDLAPDVLHHLLADAAPADYPAVAWLVKAALLLALALPLLAHIEYARDVTFHSSFLRVLRQGLAALAHAPSGPAPADPVRTHVSEVEAALEAMRAAVGSARPPIPARARLVKDLLEETR